MAKILLVEDDNNLREIYEARLQAEGHTIVSAHDGEEALVVAKAEKPDLIISDVMMPKISGFEMLDILRNTDSLKGVKVIMLTALGQNDDQQRANKLGADRYLVKSQVTLEDIVNQANSLLQPVNPPAAAGTKPVSAGITPTTPAVNNTATATQPPVANPPTQEPVTSSTSTGTAPDAMSQSTVANPSTPTPTVTSIPVATPEPPSVKAVSSATQTTQTNTANNAPESSLAESESTEQEEVKSQIEDFINQQSKPTSSPLSSDQTTATTETSKPYLKADDQKTEESNGYSPQPVGKKIIQPLPETEDKPSINELLEQEKAKEIISTPPPATNVPTMTAADTSPTPSNPVVTPNSDNPVDPDHIAL
ncbi:MAG: response regulator transcription factor [Candidatus Saccharimonadales bacterium]